MKTNDFAGIRGGYRDDGSFIGYDYINQNWIDTDPNCDRDADYEIGSACNPIAILPACPQA